MIAAQKVINAIVGTEDLAGAIRNVPTGQPIHRAFEVWPSTDITAWECCITRPISDWAFSQMVAELDRRDPDAAYDFYRTIQGTRNGAALGGQLFKIKVHKFFQSITEPRSFTIRSIDNPSATFDIELSSTIVHHAFGAGQAFAGHLTTSVRNQESCYLKPLSPIFPTFDSFLYQHEISQPGCRSLIGLQVTPPPPILSALKVWQASKHVSNRKFPSLTIFDRPPPQSGSSSSLSQILWRHLL
jgi:hypothetical protein